MLGWLQCQLPNSFEYICAFLSTQMSFYIVSSSFQVCPRCFLQLCFISYMIDLIFIHNGIAELLIKIKMWRSSDRFLVWIWFWAHISAIKSSFLWNRRFVGRQKVTGRRAFSTQRDCKVKITKKNQEAEPPNRFCPGGAGMSILPLWSSSRRLKLWTDAATQHQAHFAPYVNFSRDVLVTSEHVQLQQWKEWRDNVCLRLELDTSSFFPPVGTQYLQHPHSPPAHLSFLQDSGAPHPPTPNTSFVYT